VEFTESPLVLPPPDADMLPDEAADVEPESESEAVRVTVAPEIESNDGASSTEPVAAALPLVKGWGDAP
jgi:hypothetical protein